MLHRERKESESESYCWQDCDLSPLKMTLAQYMLIAFPVRNSLVPELVQSVRAGNSAKIACDRGHKKYRYFKGKWSYFFLKINSLQQK